MRARRTWEFSFEELLDAPVRRKHLHIEWLTKLTSKEFKHWSKLVCDVFRYSNDDETEVQRLLWEEIERKEKGYQLTREKLRLEKKLSGHKTILARFERDYKNDMLYNLKTYDIVPTPGYQKAVAASNGITKYNGKEIRLGGDLIRRDKYEPITGTTKQILDDHPF